VNYYRRRTILSGETIEGAPVYDEHAQVMRWMPIRVLVRSAANELLPGTRSRGELGILQVGNYRKVVLASPGKPTRRRGTFFSAS
jgi:hypothetical protein